MKFTDAKLKTAFNKIKNPSNDQASIWCYIYQSETKNLDLYKSAIRKFTGRGSRFIKDGWSNGGYLKSSTDPEQGDVNVYIG